RFRQLRACAGGGERHCATFPTRWRTPPLHRTLARVPGCVAPELVVRQNAARVGPSRSPQHGREGGRAAFPPFVTKGSPSPFTATTRVRCPSLPNRCIV